VALFLGFTLMDAEGYRENLLYDSVNDPRVTQQVDAATPTATPAASK
jgi:hypothetical protein